MVKKGFLVDPRVDLSEYEDDEPEEEEEIDPDSEEGMAELKAQQDAVALVHYLAASAAGIIILLIVGN